MRAFITGSHAYGTPGPESDIDLVIMADAGVMSKLSECSESQEAFRFGKLHIILCHSEAEFAAWRFSTDRLRRVKAETGVTYHKTVAHGEFANDRMSVGVEYNDDSEQEFSPECTEDRTEVGKEIDMSPF